MLALGKLLELTLAGREPTEKIQLTREGARLHWLGEGIDQDPDGQFSERSTIYSAVTDEALLDLAIILKRPALLEPVRRHLEFLLWNADADGELDVLASRRQDQQLREPRRLSA